MSGIETWCADVERMATAVSAFPSIGIELPAYGALANGMPGILPLWQAHGQTFGLLAEPDVDWPAWAGVVAADGQALTLATDARTLLPQMIVCQLASDPDAARGLAAGWNDHEQALMSLHECLGGSVETLDLVIAAASDRKTANALSYGAGVAVSEHIHGELLRQVDQSLAFGRYSDWFDSAVADRWSAPEEPSYYGAWGRRVLCWCNRLSFTQPDKPGPSLDQLWHVVEGHAGLDSGVPPVATWAVQPGEASAESALIQAALSIDHHPPVDDPVRQGIKRALLREGSAYRGVAHAEAAVVLDERGESRRAWAVLQSAAWWVARSTGQTPEAIVTGARFLARRHEWADVLWVLEHAQRRRNHE